jgi:hypothetical protein
MATKNGFNHYMFGDQTFLVSITMTTKKLPNMVLVTTLCWVIKTRVHSKLTSSFEVCGFCVVQQAMIAV